MIEAVLFDMDGVITDTEKIYHRTWPQAFHEFGYTDFTEEDALLQRSLNHADAQALWAGRFGADFCFADVKKRNYEMVLEIIDKEGIERKPGIEEILDYLKASGIKAAVVTATKYDRAIRRLDAVGLADAFETIVSASMVKIGKPHPDVYLYACDKIGVTPEHCIALEDSPNGIRSAASAGCKAIMIPDLTGPTPELAKLFHAWAPNLSAVIPIIEEMR